MAENSELVPPYRLLIYGYVGLVVILLGALAWATSHPEFVMGAERI